MRVVGLISGTSADAIEAVLCRIEGAPPRLEVEVIDGLSVPFPRDLQQRVHDAATVARSDVRAITLLDADLGEQFAAAALALISASGLSPDQVDLIGCHGQTIWHAVREDGSVASTLQIGNGSFVAERTGVTTINDLRSRDVAAGGQGAPIVAYVDWLMLRHASLSRAVQNLGGIGNVAFLPPTSDDATTPMAFDTGPANVLIDVIVTLLSDGRRSFDEDGAMAARGRVDESWIEKLLDHPYYRQAPPKTTGRELYSPAMGAALLVEGRARGLADDDIVATITAYSADSVIDQYRRFLPRTPDEVIVAGGGTRNPTLMARLAAKLPRTTALLPLEDLGYASHQKEAIAIAVLANETWHGRPGTLPAFTGARHPVIMGSITPGRLTPQR